MPDPTDPFDRLDRLAPVVDADAATNAFARRRVARTRRRRAVTGAGVAVAVLLVAGAALALGGADNGGQEVYTVSTTEAPSTSLTAPVGLVEGERRTTTSEAGITLVMDTPETATVGERMWVDVTLTNGRTEPISIARVASCNDPIGVLAGSPDAVASVDAANEAPDFSDVGQVEQAFAWSGDLDDLARTVDQAQPPKLYLGRAEALAGIRDTSCEDRSAVPTLVDPGATLSQRLAVDLRWIDGTSADGRSLEVLARVGRITWGADGAELDRLGARQPVTLVDRPDRASSRAAAMGPDGVAAAPTLDAWLGERILPDDAQRLRYAANLTWWRGAWELWIMPAQSIVTDPDSLRIRYDADREGVVDVRAVPAGSAPSDDPDAIEPVDEIRYEAG